MIWDHDGTPVTPAAAVVRPAGGADVAAVLRVCNEAHVPVTAAAGRSGVCGASMPVHGGIVLDLTAITGIVDVDATALVLDVRAGTFGTPLEADAAHRSRRHPRALAPVDRPLHRRRLAGVPQRGPAVDALREDRGHGARSRRRARRRPHRAHGRRAARRGRARPEPAVRRQRGHPRGDHRRAPARAPGADRARCGPRSGSPGSPPASTRAAASCAAARPRRCSACTTPSRPTGTSRPATHAILLVLDEGDPAIVDAVLQVVREECADATPDDPALLDRWLERRNDVSALGHFIETGYVVDTMEIAAPVVAPRPGLRRRAHRAAGGRRHGAARRPTSRTRTSTARASTSPSAATRRRSSVKRFYRAAWDAGMEATLAGGAALSHHHGIGLNRGRYARAALGDGVRRARGDEGRARPPRDPQPGQARPPPPVGRTRLAMRRLLLAFLVLALARRARGPAGSVPERRTGSADAEAVDHDHDHHVAGAPGVRRRGRVVRLRRRVRVRHAQRPGRLEAAGRRRAGGHRARAPPGDVAGRAHRLAGGELRRTRRVGRRLPPLDLGPPARRWCRSRFDVVSFDPRGTGASRPIDCVDDAFLDLECGCAPDPEHRRAARHRAPVQRSSSRRAASSAWARTPGRSAPATSRATSRRSASRSASRSSTTSATRTAPIVGITYAQMFPTTIRSMVLDGPPDYWLPARDYAYQQAGGFMNALGAFLDWCDGRPPARWRRPAHRATCCSSSSPASTSTRSRRRTPLDGVTREGVAHAQPAPERCVRDALRPLARMADPRRRAHRGGAAGSGAEPAVDRRPVPRPRPRRHVEPAGRGQRGDQLRRPARRSGRRAPRASSPTSSGSRPSSRRGAGRGATTSCVGMPKPAKGDTLGDGDRAPARRRSS